MALGDVIARLAVNLSLETAAFEKGATLAEKRMNGMAKQFEKLGNKMSDMGQKLTIGVTAPLVAFGATAVKAAVESRDAMAQVDAALKSMGKAAGRTSKQLSALAEGQMRKSLYDDDEILRKVTANLLTFGKISGKTFDAAQQAAIDLSARLGTDLQSSTIMVGKALNDPIKGVTALTRVGVSFTEQQKEQIKAMAASGNLVGAQNLMLAELAKQYGGAAEAARKADPAGAFKQSFAEFQETVGEKLLPALVPVVEALTRILDKFAQLPPGAQTAIIAIGGLAAAVGPLLMVLGPVVGMMAPFLGAMKLIAAQSGAMVALRAGIIGIATAFGPMLLAAGAAYLIWKNWDDIAPRLKPIVDQLAAIGEGLGIVEQDAKATSEEIARTEPYRQFGRDLVTLNSQIEKTFLALDKGAGDAGLAMRNFFTEMWASFERFTARLNQWPNTVRQAFANVVTIGREIVAGLARGIKESPQAVWNALKGVISTGIANAKNFLGIASPSRVFMEIGDFIGQGLAIGIEKNTGKVSAATKKLTEEARKAADEIRSLFARLFPEIELANNFKEDLKRIEGSKFSGEAKEEARRRLWRELPGGERGDIRLSDRTMNQGPLIDVDASLREFEKLAEKAKTTKVRVVESFKDMADKTIQSFSNLANAIKGGGFLGILEAVIGLGLQLGSIGAFGKKVAGRINKVPGYAGGTNFHPGGMAIVGERGPELVNLPRGSQVFPNGTGPSSRGGTVININAKDAVLTQQVRQWVAEGMAMAADAGGDIGVARVGYRQRRRVA